MKHEKKGLVMFFVALLLIGCNNSAQFEGDTNINDLECTMSESRNFTNNTSSKEYIYQFLQGNKKYLRSINKNGYSGYYIAMKGEGDKKWTPEHYTTSEAMGYGMRLAIYGWKGMVVNNSSAGYIRSKYQTAFNNIWKLQHSFTSTEDSRLHSWVIPKTMKFSDRSDAASDGEMDMAYALLQADKLWGHWPGTKINYKAEAMSILDGVAESLTNTVHIKGRDITYLTVGDWVKPGYAAAEYSRPSDWMLHHFRTFIRFLESENRGNSETAKTFKKLLEDAEYVISLNIWNTGLVPDFIRFNKKANRIEAADPNSKFAIDMGEDVIVNKFSWNACRVPWRLAMDYIQDGVDTASVSRTALNNIYLSVLAGKHIRDTGYNYNLNGTATHNYFENAFASPFAAATLGYASFAKYRGQYLNRINTAKEYRDYISKQFSGDPEYGYFGDSITAFCLVIMENDKRVIASPY